MMRLRTSARMQPLTYSQTRFYRSNRLFALIIALLLAALVLLSAIVVYRTFNINIVAAYKSVMVRAEPTLADATTAEQQLRTFIQQQVSQLTVAQTALGAALKSNANISRDEFFNIARPIVAKYQSVAAVTYFVPTNNQTYAEAEGRMFAESIPGYIGQNGKIFFPVRYRLAAADGRADLLSTALAQSPLTASTLYNALNNKNQVAMSPIINYGDGNRMLWFMAPVLNATGSVQAIVGLQIDITRWGEAPLPPTVAVRVNNVSSAQLDPALTVLGAAVPGHTLLKSSTLGVAPTYLMMGIYNNIQGDALAKPPVAAVIESVPTTMLDAVLWIGIVMAVMGVAGTAYFMLAARTKQAAYLWHKLTESRQTVAELSDIHTRKQQDDEIITDSDKIFKQLLHSTDVIPWIANLTTNTFIYIGPQAQEQIGHPMTVWRSTGFLLRHAHPDDRTQLSQYLQQAAYETGTMVHEYRLRRTDGTIRWMRCMFSLAKNTQMTDFILHGFMTDITEQRNAQDTMRFARDTAERANRTKSEFLATMSHELRTPLNAIIGFSEIIQQEILGPLGNDKYREYIKNIHVSGKHLLDLINDVLDLSKIEAGHLELQEEEILMSDLIESCRSLVAERAQRSGVKLEIELPQTSVMLVADGRRLKQVLINLLSNAIKFTASGGRVTLRGLRNSSKGVNLVVEDTGVGMAADQIPRALEKFRQADSGAARAHEGTGLGLPIAKSLTELHGGTLLLESVYGKGTTVTIALPASRVQTRRSE